MKKLTQKQADVLAHIKSYIKKNGFSPTIKEIAKHFDMFGGGAQGHINALVKKGAVTRHDGIARSIIPVKGFRVRIKAG